MKRKQVVHYIFTDRQGPGWPDDAHSDEFREHQLDTHAGPRDSDYKDTDLAGRATRPPVQGPHQGFPGKTV